MGIRLGIGGLKIGQRSGTAAVPFDWSSYWATLISATVEDAASTNIVLTFAAANPLVTSADFTIAGYTVNSGSWAGAVFTIVLAENVVYGDTLIVTFTKSGGTAAVTNNVYNWFVITVDTTKAGSAADTFVLPVTAKSASDYYVDWGDGGAIETFTTTGDKTHVYAASGTYNVKIRGGLTALSFNNLGDKLKVTSINHWGNIVWSSMAGAFRGCSNLVGNYTDTPNTSSVQDFSYMFNSCSSFNSDILFDTSAATNMLSMFQLCLIFNKPLNSLNVNNVKNMRAMLYNAAAFNQSLSTWNTSKVEDFSSMIAFSGLKQSLANFSLAAATNVTDMLKSTNINTVGTSTNYDNTLIAWAATDVPNSLNFNGGTSKYGEGLVDNGTTDGVAANKLIQSGQNFLTTVTVGDVVYNTTDGTYAFVTGIDSDTQLSISANIMASGEAYRIQHGAGAKARASLIIDDLWTITDGGYL